MIQTYLAIALSAFLLLALGGGTGVATAQEKACLNQVGHNSAIEFHEQNKGKLTLHIQNEADADRFHRAMQTVLGHEGEGVSQYDGFADEVKIYKFYPNAAMFIAFKDGCYVAAKLHRLDLANVALEKYHKGDL